MPLALDPQWNLRVLAHGDAAGLAALAGWMGGLQPVDAEALYVLAEGIRDALRPAVDAAAAAAVSCHARGERLALYASPSRLYRAAALLEEARAPLGRELSAALAAFEAARRHPARTLVMGILNVTPDSFSDGGEWLDPGAAAARGLEMAAQGADVLDIGGESTRPGAAEVPEEEETRRVLPVLERLRPQTRALISIDTRKAAVAARCLDAGADWINDVSGLTRDPSLAGHVARHPRVSLVLMHSRLRPAEDRYSTEYDAGSRPVYEDVVADTLRWLREQARRAMERGVSPERLWIDPGFGFGKSFEQNVEILRRLREYTSAGLPVLVGTSRKSSVGRLLGDLPADQRLEGTAATVAWAIAQGAAAVRVHDVREMARVARVTDALRGVPGPDRAAGSG